MTFELKPEEREVLEKIDFVNRYRELYSNYSDYDNTFEDYEVAEIERIIKSFGYSYVRYYRNEDFFKVDEAIQKDLYDISFNISLKYGFCEFIWDGMPWRMFLQLIGVDFSNIKKPAFHSYVEIRDILGVAFQMYEEYKEGLIAFYTGT